MIVNPETNKQPTHDAGDDRVGTAIDQPLDRVEVDSLIQLRPRIGATSMRAASSSGMICTMLRSTVPCWVAG